MKKGHHGSLHHSEPFVLFHGREQNQKMVALGDVNVAF